MILSIGPEDDTWNDEPGVDDADDEDYLFDEEGEYLSHRDPLYDYEG